MGLGNSLRAGRAVIEISLTTNRLQRQLTGLARMVAGVGRRLTSLGTLGASSGGLGGLFNLLVGSQAARALAWPVQLAANLEKTQAGFTALTGDAEQAKRLVGDLEQFSKISLVDLKALEQAAELLLGFGQSADNTKTIVKALSAVARGDSQRLERLALAIAQVNTANRLMGQEARQAAESGLNLLSLIAEKTGESIEAVRERMAAGAISAHEVNEALVRAASGGGRFGQVLEKMSATVLGQFNKLKSGVRLLVRPIGQELLPSLRSVLMVLNDAIAPATVMMKNNAGLAAGVVALTGSLLGGLAALAATGLAVQVLGFGLAGLAGLAGAGGSALGAMLSPVGLLVAGLAGLSTWFVRSTETGQGMATKLASHFEWMRGVFGQTWKAITKALAGGDLAAAGRVAMAGLQLAWLEGTGGLREIWSAFRNVIEETTHKITFAVMEAFEVMFAHLKRGWLETRDFVLDLLDVIYTEAGKLGKSQENKDLRDQLLYDRINERESVRRGDAKNLEAQLQKKLDAIEAARVEAAKKRDNELVGRLEKQRQALMNARAEYEKARAAASQVPPVEAAFGGLPGQLKQAAAVAHAAAGGFQTRQGAFGGRGLGQRADRLGVGIAQSQLKVLEDVSGFLSNIDRNLEEGLVTVV